MRVITGDFIFQYNEALKNDIIIYVYKMLHDTSDPILTYELKNNSILELKVKGVIDKNFYDELFIYKKDFILDIIEGY